MSPPDPKSWLADRRPAALPANLRPVLVVVVDTEEEFDWSQPFDRANTSVEAMRDVHRIQSVFDEFEVKPTYVADYPVVTQEHGAAPLREFQEQGRALVGAHLHPWVSPPFDEEVCARNSYPGNLPRELEARKLELLTQAHEEHIGRRPTVYKAGRYGFGPHTGALLEELGYEADLSFCCGFDLTGDGGPDYTDFPADPYWFGSRPLLGVPTTGGFAGFCGAHPALYRLATRPSLRWARLPGILSRLKAIERILLSPEGYQPGDHRRLTSDLLRRGVRVFSFSFHSPSSTPGCTPYVQSEKELGQFLDRCRYYLEFFLGELGGVALTPLELREQLTAAREAAPA